MPAVSRRKHVNVSGLGSLDEALAWIVQRYDAEFGGHEMITINIQQILTEHADGWGPEWSASISGHIEEKES